MEREKRSFTPGPWKYDLNPTHGWAIYQEGTDSDEYGNPGGVVGTSEWIWLEEANAKLISAAPEMLGALRAIESCLAPEDNDRAAKLVRDAIRKATEGG